MLKNFEPNKIFVITSKAPKYVLGLFFIIVFILVSLFSMLFIKNKILVILIPMLLTHVLFIIFNRKNKKENLTEVKKLLQ